MGRPFAPHFITDDSALGSSVIQKSLRFNPNANLTRTSSSTSTTFTYSVWIKRCQFSGYQYFFSMAGKGFAFHTSNNTMYLYDGTSLNESTAVFRDPSAWYHIVVQINSGTATSYVNNVLTHNAVGGGAFTLTTGSNQTRIGSYDGDYYFHGYMAEIHLVDGSVVAPSSFGFTDSQTGIWMPQRYTGSHGTNGFYLNFLDNSSTSALGKDTSGNGNDFTTNGFSVSSGYGNDSVTDTCTNNFATMNPLVSSPSVTWANGNLDISGSNATEYSQNNTSTFGVSSGKWYVEVKYASAGSNTNPYVGICPIKHSATTNMTGAVTDAAVLRMSNETYIEGSDSQNIFPSGISVGNTIGIALDMDNLKVWFSVQGTYANSGDPATGTNAIFSGITAGEIMAICARPLNGSFNLNFGQRPFSYTPPTGYKAWSSNNIPPTTPIIRPQKHFGVVTWSANSSTSNRKISGLEFKPDLVWTKTRNHGYHHVWMDSVRGPSKRLNSDQNFVEDHTNGGHLASFDHDGFTWQYGGTSSNAWWNDSGKNYIAWCWKAGGAAVANSDGTINTQVSVNEEAGFSIVTYTGNGSTTATIGHGLGKTPACIILKNRSSSADWVVMHSSTEFYDGGNYKHKPLKLNTNDALVSILGLWATPNSSTQSISDGQTSGGNRPLTNTSGNNYVAYFWAEIPGYSKFGFYTGNGSTEGVYVHTGFRPAFIMIKSTSQTTNWNILTADIDGYNLVTKYLDANSSSAEGSYQYGDLLSNGFKARNTGGSFNQNGGTYIYMAFAEQIQNTPFGSETNAR